MGLRDLVNKVPAPLKQAVKDVVYPEMLREGALTPEWSLQDQDGKWHPTNPGRWAILVFYPSDDTPGCTLQLQAFQRYAERLNELDVSLYGVNHADANSHAAFANKCDIGFPLLVDRGGSVSQQFRCSLPLPYGVRIIRSVYLVDPEGKVRFANRGAPSPETIIRRIEVLQEVTKTGE